MTAHWLQAARDPLIVSELEAIFAYAAAAIESRGPACWASGRCCNFDAAGHRLYVTALEAAYTLSRLDSPLTRDALAAAVARGGCPFQVANLCSVHAVKPLACRLYFCDRSAQDWQHDLSERLIAQLKSLHERHSIEYRYAEWRGLLAEFLTASPGTASA